MHCFKEGETFCVLQSLLDYINIQNYGERGFQSYQHDGLSSNTLDLSYLKLHSNTFLSRTGTTGRTNTGIDMSRTGTTQGTGPQRPNAPAALAVPFHIQTMTCRDMLIELMQFGYSDQVYHVHDPN